MSAAFRHGAIRQIAYRVDDVHAAAERHAELFGSGPFLTVELPPLDCVFRGRPMPFEHVAAFGQWGAIQVELLQDTGTGPSILRELPAEIGGRSGIHHVAMFVDDLEVEVARLSATGFPEVMRVTPAGWGVSAVFVDTVATYGHFLELYEPAPLLLALYDQVARAADGFDGREPVRPMKL